MWEIWANWLLPKTLKSCPKSNKSPNLVTLILTILNFSQPLELISAGLIAKMHRRYVAEGGQSCTHKEFIMWVPKSKETYFFVLHRHRRWAGRRCGRFAPLRPVGWLLPSRVDTSLKESIERIELGFNFEAHVAPCSLQEWPVSRNYD